LAADRKQSFWSTAPWVITAVAALISAIGVLIGALAGVGVIGGDDSSDSGSPATVQTGTVGSAPSSDGFDRITQYGGTWATDEAVPNTVTRVEIAGSGPLVNVHALAACQPVDCDWGTRSPDFADPLVAMFDLGNGHTEKLTMLLSADATRLDVTEQSSVSGTHRYAFHR